MVRRQKMELMTIYDNYKIRKDLAIGWGFSCLVSIDNKKIVFDVGEEDKKIFSNMKKLKIDIKDIDILIISHRHWDHTGGLKKIKELNPKLKIIMPNEFSEPIEIMKDVYSTGAMKSSIYIKEQVLILNTKKGLVIVAGCAHPGITEIIRKSKEFFKEEIYLVLGGFHLLDMEDTQILKIIKEFRNLEVKNVAPSHCTGERAIRLFREEYQKNFMKNGAGKIINI
jgi:7,8-dihydropterin-6-yl-methyl-4-(beta-D-ribofuranosyl)aminobenzene 5'-phosphate synthase